MRVLTTILALGHVPLARAESVPEPTRSDDERRLEAKTRFLRGVALTRESNWDAALAEFLASSELHPTRVALSNAAVCLRNLRRYTQALATYDKVLRDFGATLSEEQRAAVEQAMAELRQHVGEVEIATNVDGATIVVDGEPLGTTPIAPLPVDAGTRLVRVSKPGFVTFEARVVVAGKQRRVVPVQLVPLRRDGVGTAPSSADVLEARTVRSPAPPKVRSTRLYAELVGGLAWAPSFGGDSEAACDASSSACSDRDRPLGGLLGARAGYELGRGLGVELFAGYLALSASQRRVIEGSGEPTVSTLTSDDYRDETSVRAGVAALSASYRVLAKTPLTFRVWAGVGRAFVETANRGTFTGTYTPTGGSPVPLRAQVAVPEVPRTVWMPIGGSEVRFGVRLSQRLSMDAGVAALWAFPGDTPRNSDNVFGRTREGRRTGRLPTLELERGGSAEPGTITLPTERALGGGLLILLPTVGMRLDF